MIKNPKLGQTVWFIEDFTMRPRQVSITCIKDQGVYVDEERFFRLWNLYRSKQKAITAKIIELDKDIEAVNERKLKLTGYLDK